MPKFRNKAALDKLAEECLWLKGKVDYVPSAHSEEFDAKTGKHIEIMSYEIARIWQIIDDLTKKEASDELQS